MGYSTNARGYAPASGTRRIYVDAAAGSDASSGVGGWANAWKTLSRLLVALATEEALCPTALKTYARIRGSFGANDHLALAQIQRGYGSRVVIGCDFADSLVVQSGTVTTVDGGVVAPKFDLMRVELGGGITLTAADEGREVRFDDGVVGHKATFKILWVPDAAHAWISCRYAASWKPEYPAWLVGGGTVNAIIFESGAVVQGRIGATGTGRCPAAATDPDSGFPLMLLNIRTYNTVLLSGLANAALWLDARNAAGAAKSIYGYGCSYVMLGGWVDDWLSSADLAEYGYTDTATGCFSLGSRGASAVQTAGGQCITHGYFTNEVQFCNAFGSAMACRARSYRGYGVSRMAAINCMSACGTSTSFPPFYVTNMGHLQADQCTVITTPAAGLASGLFVAYDRGRLNVTNCEGNNTGTGGSGLYGIVIDRDGSVEIDGASLALIKGKHGKYRVVNGRMTVTSAATIGAEAGGGPDGYVGAAGDVYFADNVIKSATNPSGGGGAVPVLKWERGGKVAQASGKAFTLPAGSGNNATDYGATGALDGADANAVLGVLTGGGAGTTGVACTLAYGVKLRHGGVGPSGVAPLKFHGAAAAQAWPAAPTSDAAAAVPEDCWIYPNVA